MQAVCEALRMALQTGAMLAKPMQHYQNKCCFERARCIPTRYTARQRGAMTLSVWQCGSRVVHSSAVIERGTAARALGSSQARH